MEKHSLWETILTVLANLVSKFVKRSRLRIFDESNGGYITVTVTAPYVIKSANNVHGEISIIVGKEYNKDEEVIQN